MIIISIEKPEIGKKCLVAKEKLCFTSILDLVFNYNCHNQLTTSDLLNITIISGQLEDVMNIFVLSNAKPQFGKFKFNIC